MADPEWSEGAAAGAAAGAAGRPLKLVLVGDSGTGKSALARRFIYGDFVEQFVSTIGVDFASRRL